MGISRVFIINRGEIAVRIIRTCRVLGLETVLAVSEADRDSLGARLADQTVVIGPPNVSTYLNIPVLMKTALEIGAEAVHPGYGFLSEKPELAQACVDNGLIFIGPKADHMQKMGNKLIARSIARECAVPILPGSEKVNSFEEILSVVKQIGFPLMIKAAAGGGGRGMKIVTETEKEKLKKNFEEASAEARAAFGDGSLYVEKYVANARHIEVQVLGDRFGNVIHLGERDCSTQRRHQKLIEEAGAPLVSEELLKWLHGAAVLLAKNIAYENAGTVEFIFDQDEGKFYFMEMNTRIQVEHPVTEMITGVDIVQEQINVADGGKLPFTQAGIHFNGHSLECRINAEKPDEGFRPTPGVITKWEIPQGPGVRVDTHCYHGYKVPIFYDSLIAKLIVHGTDRDHAIRRMLAALGEFKVEGISTTIPFLQKILRTPEFAKGGVNTRILEKVQL
jgi:acetyl-CoA carboxylase, biotin carboxylase subunit